MRSTQGTAQISRIQPKTIGYEKGGAALRSAIEAGGSSLNEVAECWGVSNTIVDRVLAGGAPLTWERILLLPAAVRLALMEPEIARCREQAEGVADRERVRGVRVL